MKKTVGFIGGGNMGVAIIHGIIKNYCVVCCEKDKRKAASLRRKYNVACPDLPVLLEKSDVIILAVKPQDIDGILEQVAPVLKRKQCVISIAAGITLNYLQKKLTGNPRVIRVMPNMPAQIAEGITAISKGKFASSQDVKLAQDIFKQVGKTVVVQEKFMDAVTAVSGSGPAYVFHFVECIMKAAKSLGLDDRLSKELIQTTLIGSARLLEQQKESAATLRAKVTSKGGTTQAAMDVFMKNKTGEIYTKALKAAKKRGQELSKK